MPTKANWELVLPDLKVLSRSLQLVWYSWLSFVVVTSTSSFDLFHDKIQFLQPSILVVKDCKPLLLAVSPTPRPMFFQGLLDLVLSSEWFLQSSKPWVVIVFACVPFPCFLFSAFLFSLCHLVSNYPSFVTPIIFLDMIQICDTFLVSF